MDLKSVEKAAEKLKGVILRTPLQRNDNISDFHQADVFLKREDLQNVRSYKIRGAYNKISSLNQKERERSIVCASAGNHAQGVALSCHLLTIKGVIFMPVTTPEQKVNKVRRFGGSCVEIVLFGDTFDQAQEKAAVYCQENNAVFIHPFDDEKIIEGQATIALEILNDMNKPIDYLVLPIGGGGLSSGVSEVFKILSPETKIIGVEPTGAASMHAAFDHGSPVHLAHIERFVDGAAVQKVGLLNYQYCQKNIDQLLTVDEGKVCSTLLKLYNEDGMIVEPAGALAISALDSLKEDIKEKTVVCMVSGSNNDITRMEEIKERSLMYEGLKHYFIIRFPQRAGALKEFVNHVLGPTDDITFFEYSKKNSREKGPALIGIELKTIDDLEPLKQRMASMHFVYEYFNDKQDLFQFLI